jgi:hypothetical protein
MKVKALRQVCGSFGSFKPGAVFELSSEKAMPMIEAGAAEAVKEEKKIVFETAVVEPEIETAEAKPKRKAKGKHVSGKK